LNDHPDVVTICYHTPWPGALDELYLHNPEQNLARTEYFGIPYVPYFWFDGVSRVLDYINYSFYLNAYLPRAAEPTEVLLEQEGSLDPNSGEVNFTVTATLNETVPAGDYRLHVVLVEDEIEWAAPNGETIHHHVMRRMYPDAEGTPVTLSDSYPQTVQAAVDFTLDDIYVPEHCTIVYFLQENDGREVHQAGQVALDDLSQPTTVPEISLGWELEPSFPNPFNPSTTIPLRMKENGTVELAIYAADGRLVRRLHQGELAPGLHHFIWDGRNEQGTASASGVYLVHSNDSHHASQSHRIVLVK